MRVVVALGGNALLKRGEPMTAENQRANVRSAAPALAAVADEHELVLSHGNGPQVGLLALQAAAYTEVEAYPLDILGAQTEGMIGYVLEQELGNVMPPEAPLATILTMVEVDPEDPAFQDPTKFVGPIYTKAEADVLHAAKGWVFKPDGDSWRRVVPSPEPRHIFEIDPIRWLLEHDVVIICAGGGGVPTMFLDDNEQTLVGVEAVIDKDLASELLAREVAADLLRHGHRRRRGVRRLGHAAAAGPGPRDDRRAAPDQVPGRLDGTQGRRGVPLRRGDRWARRDRRAHTDPADRRGRQRAPRWCQERRSDDHVRGSLRGRTPATGDGPPPGAESPAVDTVHPRRSALRRRPVGRARAVRARPVRRQDAGARRRGLPAPDPPRRGARGQRRGAEPPDRGGRFGVHRGAVPGGRGARRARRDEAGRARHPPHRRPHRRRVRARRGDVQVALAAGGSPGRREHVRAAAPAEHPVHA